MANHPTADQDAGAAPDISRYLRTEASGAPPLPPGQAAAAPFLRDMQKALVERIADVDDDRRRGAAALLKAFNAHRAQVRAHLKHQQLTFGLVLGLPLLLLAGWLFGLAWTSSQQAARQDTRLAALEAGLVAVPGPEATLMAGLTEQVAALRVRDAELARELEALRTEALTPAAVAGQLAGQLAPLLERLTALENRPEPLAVGASTGKVTTTAIREAAHSEVTTAVDELRRESATALAALRAELAALQGQADGNATVSQEAAVAAALARLTPQLVEAATGQAVAAVNASLAPRLAQAAASATAAAEAVAALDQSLAGRGAGAGPVTSALPADATELPLDALIEQQLARLAEELQRLARAVGGPEAPAAGAPPAGDVPPATTTAGVPVSPSPANAAPTMAPPADGADAEAPALADGTDRRRVPDPEQAPEPVPESELTSKPAPPSGLDGPTVQVGTRRYALQLIGFRDPTELLDFVARHPLPAQVYAREEQLRGRPWYVLIHSLHADLAGASAAQAGLPPDLAAMDLWIRSLPADAELRVIETGR